MSWYSSIARAFIRRKKKKIYMSEVEERRVESQVYVPLSL
jgi:hypothetical protein